MKLLDYYQNKLNNMIKEDEFNFIKKYLSLNIMKRLKEITYLCGMEYASNDIYSFKEEISRYDHSLNVAMLTWIFSKDKKSTLAALFHDISTPCFSHVIDYMNKDYEKQDSTEEYTEKILKSDSNLKELLYNDCIDIDDVVNFKKYSIVDTVRPKLCADRIDGIILTGMSWSGEVDKSIIDIIIDNMDVYINEDGEKEIGFNNKNSALTSLRINDGINKLCQSKSDYYMMQLLADIIKKAIERKCISYDDLYLYGEEYILRKLDTISDSEFRFKLFEFYNIHNNDIPDIEIPKLKVRSIRPLVDGKRI